MRYEVEQKYRIQNPAFFRKKLKTLGAKKISSGAEYNEFYAHPLLAKKLFKIRLRRTAKKSTLTLKGARLPSSFTKRLELETPVDFPTAQAILKFLDFQRGFSYTKKREEYRSGTCLITLDKLPKLGWFLEIEGAESQIRKIEKRLGLKAKDREMKSYFEMLGGLQKPKF